MQPPHQSWQEGASFLALVFGLSVASREVLAAGASPRLLHTRQHPHICSLSPLEQIQGQTFLRDWQI